MTNGDFGSLTLLLFVLLASAHALGHLFTRLRQPRVIGEILAGVLLGPALLGHFAPEASAALFAEGAGRHDVILSFVYWLGLLLLMFVSGAETRHLFAREDRRETAWIAGIGTGLPFLLALVLVPFLPLDILIGPAADRTALVLVIGIAVAVTSIPVISRIFHDLGILHTRFAGLVLGVAVIEDIALWAVLAIATALAGAAVAHGAIAAHIAATIAYFAAGLTVAPALLRKLGAARWNILATASPVGYVVSVLLGYSAVASLFDVSPVFAAFLAGYGLLADRPRFTEALDAVAKFSFAVFVPLYFVVVGYKLDLSGAFSFTLLLAALFVACASKLAAVALGARLAGFCGLDVVNLAVATNARGGPGIVLASVAYDAGIINPVFYTTLVLLAVLTSQAAGAWLEFVLRRGWPLLSAQPAAPPLAVPANDSRELAA
jgi:Kef-type K+ transport system membrane component KefB